MTAYGNSRTALLETWRWVGDAIVRPPTLNWSMGNIRERDRQRCDAKVVLGDMEMEKKEVQTSEKQAE